MIAALNETTFQILVLVGLIMVIALLLLRR